MRKSRPGESRFPRRLAGATGLLTVAGAGAAVAGELRHRSAVTHDPVWGLLRSPLRGSDVDVVSADGARLHAEVFGSLEGPTFVLVPGWTEELQVFDLLTRVLVERGYRVVSFDLRGQGLSDAVADLDLRIERYGEDVAAVLDATCAGRDDVILAGHSLGGMAVVAWAGQADDVVAHVRAAALISTGVSRLFDELAVLPAAIPAPARRQLLASQMLADRPLPPFSTPLSRAINRRLMFGPHATAGQLALMEPMIWRMHPKLRAAAGRTISRLELSDSLASLTVPTLVVVGDVDRLTPPVHARRMVAALPHLFEFELLPETGHLVPLERPIELLEALVSLADSVGLEPAG